MFCYIYCSYIIFTGIGKAKTNESINPLYRFFSFDSTSPSCTCMRVYEPFKQMKGKIREREKEEEENLSEKNED